MDSKIIEKVQSYRDKYGEDLIILAHHYVCDELVELADVSGDSLELAKYAAKTTAKKIIFCGVHFMAESADILTSDDCEVYLPNLKAGCFMANLARPAQLERAWSELTSITNEKIIPVTYINSTAAVKDFVGRNGGITCTSSNAEKVLNWAFEQGSKVLFLPDQHLGRNTAFEMGIPLEEMCDYDFNRPGGGIKDEELKNAKMILWSGYCNIHQFFKVSDITEKKIQDPSIQVIVHPECCFDLVQKADMSGSTSKIIKTIAESPNEVSWAVGTEFNLVNRLAMRFPDKIIVPLSKKKALCATMKLVTVDDLLNTLDEMDRGDKSRQIVVDKSVAENSRKAINRMMELT